MSDTPATPTPEWPHASWDDVATAVADASNNAEGRVSAYYLEYHFQKEGLVVLYHVDMPEHPATLLHQRDALVKALEDIVAQFTPADAAVLAQWEGSGTECLTDEKWNMASSAKHYADFARAALASIKE